MVNGIVADRLTQALDLMSSGEYIPYAGGTDLMIEENDGRKFLFLHKITDIKNISADGAYIRLGAGLTFSELLRSPVTPPLLKQAVSQIGAPAIRNLGTIGGNIANGSPKADSALIFFVTDCLLRLSRKEGERLVPIKNFYLGRKKLDLHPNELITEILMPINDYEYYYKKIGARCALAISRLSFAGLARIHGGVVEKLSTAFGAVGDVIIRRADIDALLEGKPLSDAKSAKKDYLIAYESAINPISGRISAQYRKDVCINLLIDFLEAVGI